MKHANIALFVPHLGCPHHCLFCDQNEISGSCRPPSPDDVRGTAQAGLRSLKENPRDAEIAFFGGSFTAIDRAYMISLLEAAAPFIGQGGFKGIRISTRPDAVDEDILRLLKRYGVTSIELGAQSMSDEVLMKNGRGHTAGDVVAASRAIRSSGFELGLQMMTGLYGDTDDGARRTAERLARLEPVTIRIYPALVIKNTGLEKCFRAGRYRPQTLEEAVSLCSGLLRFFTEKKIRVIRLGLHAERSLEKNYVAGPMHPAFRELCESRIYRGEARKALAGAPRREGAYTVLEVNRSAVSKMAGQHRENIRYLEQAFQETIKIEGRESIPEYTVRLKDNGKW